MNNVLTVEILTKNIALHSFGVPLFNVVVEHTDSQAWRYVYILNMLLTELPHGLK